MNDALKERDVCDVIDVKLKKCLAKKKKNNVCRNVGRSCTAVVGPWFGEGMCVLCRRFGITISSRIMSVMIFLCVLLFCALASACMCVLASCCATVTHLDLPPHAQTPWLHPSHEVIYDRPVPARLNSLMPIDGILLKRLLLVDDAAVELGLDA